MTESSSNRIEVTAWLSFAVGLIVFLIETRFTGEALERFGLRFSSSTLPIIGGSLMIVSVGVLALMYFIHRHNI